MRRLLALAVSRPLPVRLPSDVGGLALRRFAFALRPSPPVLAGLLVVLLAATGGWMWLRDSSLVGVRKVEVTGLTGPQAGRIRTALEGAARNMTTLHVSVGALRDAASPFPIVKDLRVSARPPHLLRISVEEQDPVAAVLIDGRPVAVAPDGSLLRDTGDASRLALLPLDVPPGGERITAAPARREIALMAAAPAALRAQITRVNRSRSHGMVALVRGGPALFFGGPSRLAAKWAAVAAVLADNTSAGARYVDVRVPERPAAGGVPAPLPASPSGVAPGAGAGASPGTATAPSSGSAVPPATATPPAPGGYGSPRAVP